MILEIWNIFSEVFDYTFPEIQVLEVVEVSTGIFRLTAYFGEFRSLNILNSQWQAMSEKNRKLMMLGFTHTCLNRIEELQNA